MSTSMSMPVYLDGDHTWCHIITLILPHHAQGLGMVREGYVWLARASRWYDAGTSPRLVIDTCTRAAAAAVKLGTRA